MLFQRGWCAKIDWWKDVVDNNAIFLSEAKLKQMKPIDLIDHIGELGVEIWKDINKIKSNALDDLFINTMNGTMWKIFSDVPKSIEDYQTIKKNYKRIMSLNENEIDLFRSLLLDKHKQNFFSTPLEWKNLYLTTRMDLVEHYLSIVEWTITFGDFNKMKETNRNIFDAMNREEKAIYDNLKE